MMLGWKAFEVLILVIWAFLISLPGIGVAYVGWRVSANMRPFLIQAVLRAGLIAIAVTPSAWGHLGIVPAVLLAIGLQGRDRLVGIVPILVVWAIALAVMIFRARPRVAPAIPNE